MPDEKALYQTLVSQVGRYAPAEPAEGNPLKETALTTRLSKHATSKQALMKGTSIYQLQHRTKTKEFKNQFGKKFNLTDLSVDDSQFFRKALVQLICEIEADPNKPQFNPDLRSSQPEKATIALEAFLGKAGAKLYQLALEEEMHSAEYRLAVLSESTSHFEGKKWKDRPAIIVAGPSGCGKSVAAKQAIQNASAFLTKIDDDTSGNYVTAADGGVARETSQMRKLVIQAANNKGYAGVSNLHQHSKDILGKMKHRVLACVKEMPDIGIVIPETFAKWNIPIVNKKARTLMPGLEDTALLVFARVKGSDPDNFQHVVGHMGLTRAWKTSGFEHKPLDMNNKKDMKESKKYGASGFKHGVNGSKEAERWFIKNRPHNIILSITNDLILLKPSTGNPGWQRATSGDAGIIIVSERTYQYWEKIKNGDLKNVPAEAKAAWDAFLSEKKQEPNPEQFSRLLPSEIKTASEAKLNSILEQLAERIEQLEEKATADKENQNLIQVITTISGIQQTLSQIDLRDKKIVDTFLMVLREQEAKMEGLNPDTKTIKLLKKCGELIVGINTTLDADEMARKTPKVEYHTPKAVTATVDAGGRWQYKTNLLDSANYAKIKNIVESDNWSIDEKTKTATALHIKSKAGEHQYKVTTDTISTKDNSEETFKMMIKTFLETQPKGKMRISAANDDIKVILEKIVREMGSDPAQKLSASQVNIQVVPPIFQAGGAMEPTPTPTPSTRVH
ncbi:MAG: hypothetical protein ACYC0J_02520 [Gammaproteobacteria bacterium]